MKKRFGWRRGDDRKQKKKKAGPAAETEEPKTLEPAPLPVLEAANLQGMGERTEQQDAFAVSPLGRYEQDGLMAVLCDGMGGMSEGGRIAADTVSDLLGQFPLPEEEMLPWLQQRSAQVYRQFRGFGGTTMVCVRLTGQRLSFWCAGDSDLLLLREGKLYRLNIRQEYVNDLILRSLTGAFLLEEAFQDRQAGALSEYIGKERVFADHTRRPFLLQPEDALLLCSDGVSDTLTAAQIRGAMALPPQACCEKLEQDILQAGRPDQDNYTAIMLKYHGKGEKKK
jgi:serine/threonine protein phosphatase PrpC